MDDEVQRAAALLANYQGPEVEFMVPKESWGPGEWQDEPDTLAFSHVGYQCWMLRNQMGAWCGYIEVPIAHPKASDNYDKLEDEEIPVHGGFTFSSVEEASGHYHYGFDCGHAGDWQPALAAFTHQQTAGSGHPKPRFGEVYRNMLYTRLVLCEIAVWFKEHE